MTYRIRDWNTLFENNRTREMKRADWVPVPNRMDGDGYTELVDHPDGAAHLGAWLAILEIASRQTPRGTFPQEGAVLPQALARMSRLPAGLFAIVLPRLVQIGWIEQLGEIPQEGAEIPQEGAPRARPRNGTERNGTEGNGAGVALSVEWPLTAKAIRETLPGTDDPFIRQIVSEAASAIAGVGKQSKLKFSDEIVAEAVRATRHPKQQSAGWFLTKVPQCVRAWANDGKPEPERY